MDTLSGGGHRHSHLVIILLSVLVGAMLTALVLSRQDQDRPIMTPAAAQQPVVTQFETVAQKVLPAVVYINSDMPVPQRSAQQDELRRQLEEFFRQRNAPP